MKIESEYEGFISSVEAAKQYSFTDATYKLVQDITTNDSQTHESISTRTTRHRFTEERQADHIGLEHKRQWLTAKGYDQNVRKFLPWCELHRHDPLAPDPAIIVNHLAYYHHYLGWPASTCHTYLAAILNLYEEKKISTHGRSMSLHRSTKVRFLLAIIGFLRPSDVRVLRQCVVSVESEVLTLVAPYWPTVLWFPLLQSLVIQSLPFLAQEENLRTAYSNQELTATTEDLLRPPRLEDNVTNRSCK
ncbi:hypothetical protein CU097_012829 [Rhizopus azygosporus]|uniref:Uncharacterized protein n=1 Tax=Rhizopus azygosporus TaxID=86630 RepID=A0A367JW25_RHIAZ|nr:hypothetical protein CU097_012829 [Rhizopus azygosporus]